MTEEMEWRPTAPRPERRGAGRRQADGDLGERMARVEERLHAVESACAGVEDAVVRVHERVDAMSRDMNTQFDMFKETVYSRLSETYDDMERRLGVYAGDQEKLFSARFSDVLNQISSVATAVNAERRENKEMVDKAVKAGAWLIGGFVAVIVPGIGYVIGQILGHLPELARLSELLEKAQ